MTLSVLENERDLARFHEGSRVIKIPAVVIVVWVAIIADTITIVIHPFLLIEREGIDIIQPAIIIIV